MCRKILAVDFADAFCEIYYQDTSKCGIEFSDHMHVKFEIFEWASSISVMFSTAMSMVKFICLMCCFCYMKTEGRIFGRLLSIRTAQNQNVSSSRSSSDFDPETYVWNANSAVKT